MNVGWLLANDGCNHASDAAKFDLDAEVCRFVMNAAYCQSVFAFTAYYQMDHSRFCRGSDHREPDGRRGGIEIQQQDKRKTICNVGREIDVILSRLAILVARGNLTAGSINRHIEWVRKRGAALDVVVADEPEGSTLSKDCGFIVQ